QRGQELQRRVFQCCDAVQAVEPGVDRAVSDVVDEARCYGYVADGRVGRGVEVIHREGDAFAVGAAPWQITQVGVHQCAGRIGGAPADAAGPVAVANGTFLAGLASWDVHHQPPRAHRD